MPSFKAGSQDWRLAEELLPPAVAKNVFAVAGVSDLKLLYQPIQVLLDRSHIRAV
jgi:hypothetical protein